LQENHKIREKCKELSPDQTASHYESQYSSFHPVHAEEEDPAPPNPIHCTEKVSNLLNNVSKIIVRKIYR